MEEQAPRVSIGLPVYNGEEFLAEAIDSLLAQTYPDFELIISDNSSTDATEDICRRYAAADRRIRYSRNSENIGGMNNANLTIDSARGDFFRLAAHDDRCAPTLLERLVEQLDQHPEIAIACTATIAIDTDGDILPNRAVGKRVGSLARRNSTELLFTDDAGMREPIEGTGARPHQRFRELTLTRAPCEAQYGLIRSNVLRQTHYFGNYTSSDVVLLCELALRGPFHLIQEPLFYKRYHSGNLYAEKGPGRMAWSRPDLLQSGHLSFPRWLQLVGLVRAILDAPIPWKERALCLPCIGRWIVMMRSELMGEIVFAVRMLAHSKAWRKSHYIEENWI